MNKRENLLSLIRREGFEFVDPEFSLSPHLVDVYKEKTCSTQLYTEYFGMPWENIPDIKIPGDITKYLPWYPNMKEGTRIDARFFGLAFEPGSSAAMHMEKFLHPLMGITDFNRIKEYPFPDYSKGDSSHQKAEVERIHRKGLAAVGMMQVTIWETSWFLRGMEDLMMDMADDSPVAAYILDKVMEQQIIRARAFAGVGADIVYLGDDIGMQQRPMMSLELYRKWLKPRLREVINAAKGANPNVLIFYHSCGHVTPFIDDLIDAGINVLNPIQPESMDWHEIVTRYKDRLSFHGCIGTQKLMPFGTPQEIKAAVKECLDAMGPGGGMFAAPTHVVEPEVPWENVMAYVDACRSYKPS